MSSPVNAEPATRFRAAHAVDQDWRVAAQRVLDDLGAQMGQPRRARRGRLGVVYLSDQHADRAAEIHATLKVGTGVADWIGAVGVAVAADGVEYVDQPAIVAMLLDLPPDSCRVFSSPDGLPLAGERTSTGALAAGSALVHVDPATAELGRRLGEIAARVDSGWVFGAMSSSRGETVQFANRTLRGCDAPDVSGVVFASDVMMRSRVTHACHPLLRRGRPVTTRRIERCDGNRLLMLDGRPALDAMLDDLDAPRLRGIAGLQPWLQQNLPEGGLHVALSRTPATPGGHVDAGVVAPVVAVDPAYRSVAIGGRPMVGQAVTFCARDAAAARADLVRVCAELREDIENDAPALAIATVGAPATPATPRHAAERIRGALYLSCVARGGRLFSRPGEELEIIRAQLGDAPLIGLYASAEIAGAEVQSQTGILTLFA